MIEEKMFSDIRLDGRVQRALVENGFEKPFPIQEAAIPLILEGKDVIGQAHTGTGKTAAFVLPLLTKMKPDSRQAQTLVLVPTRELAMQVTKEFQKFSKYSNIRAVSVYGGQSFGLQAGLMRKGAHVIVATPGRLIDHLKQRTARLDGVQFVVLDEADRMLDMGFIDDITFILTRAGKEGRQTMLFSATMPAAILKLAREHMKGDIREVRLNTNEPSLASIDQSYLLIEENQKLNQLIALIKPHSKQQIIVFAATRRRVDKLASSLKGSGFKVSAIHGDLSQKEREVVMGRFRKGTDAILVATDVVARGIDVPAVGHIINYDVPGEQDTYFHRIGRTARAGAKGRAVTLVTPDRFSDFERIMRRVDIPIKMLNESMGLAVPTIRQGGHGFHRRGASSKKWKKQTPFVRSGSSGPRRQGGFWERKSRGHENSGRGFRKR